MINILQAELEALKAKADAIGMILHPTKSQYMTVNFLRLLVY